MAVSMPHGKIYNPAKYVMLTGRRRAPKHDPDHTLAAAFEYAKTKTGLGYRLWAEFIRDFPRVRDDYTGDELAQYDTRHREIYRMLKHRDCKYMAHFAQYMSDMCEVAMRSYYKRRASNPNERRPKCTHPVLRLGSHSCVVYGRGFWDKLSNAPKQPLLESPRVVLRVPIMPSRHFAEFQLTPHMVAKLAGAISVGAVTITPTTLSIALGVKHIELVEPRGVVGMDVNKEEHTAADTDGNIHHIPNEALGYAQERRGKHHTLGVTGGKPKNKHGRRKGSNGVKHPGVKPKNKGRKAENSGRKAESDSRKAESDSRKAESDNKRVKKRRDDRVNRRERARINTRFGDKKNDWIHKTMHQLACMCMVLALEDPTIDQAVAKVKQTHVQGDTRLAKDGPKSGNRMGNCNCSVR